MKLKKQFEEFYGDIIIESEQQSLIDKRNTLQTSFENKFPGICKEHGIELNKSDIRVVDQGSYALNTTISNPYGSVDRDVAIMFPMDIEVNNDPREIKKYAKEALTIINVREPKIKEPCVSVSYPQNGEEELHIDMPLYAEFNNKYYLARGRATSETYSWEETDPDALTQYIKDCILANVQLRKIIRYLKRWKLEKYHNTENDHEVPPSIGLTLLACECFVAANEGNIDDDLTSLCKTFENIVGKFIVTYKDGEPIAEITKKLPVFPDTDVFSKLKNSDDYILTFYKRMKKAMENLQDACSVEDEYEAGICLQKVFGTDFTLPEKKVVATTTKNQREHCFG